LKSDLKITSVSPEKQNKLIARAQEKKWWDMVAILSR